MNDTGRETRAVLRNIYVCFFLSGSLGLIYEILWLRKLLLVFGSTTHAVSTVLTVFFGGLALGSWIFGRLIDRHEGAALRWYAALEVGVGLLALASLPLFDVIQRIYIPVYQASGYSQAALVGASFVCSALILLPPTILLGATLPVLSRFMIRTSEERGVKIAGLYGINTAGAMAGTLLVYYIGLPILGLIRTMVCAATLSIGIGLLCLAFDAHLRQLGFRIRPTAASGPSAGEAAVGGAQGKESLGHVRWLLFAFGLSGFSAMAYEVAWTRALSMVLGSSIYAFCIMLATFLGGIAVGSFWVRRDLRTGPATIRMFIQIEILLGLYGLFSIPLFSQLPDWLVAFWPLTGGTFGGMLWLQFFMCALAMLLPTLLMGFLFPVVSDLVTHRFAQLGQRLGTTYAVNTAGGIIGSFMAGFVLIPLWGLQWAVIGAALVNFVAGLLIYARFGARGSVTRRTALAAASLLGVVVLSQTVVAPAWQQGVFVEGVYMSPGQYAGRPVQAASAGSTLLYYRDSLNTTVSVHQRGETIFLKVGGKTDASTGLDMGTQVLSAHIPLLLHPDPQRVLVIGLGSGVTLGSAGRHAVSTLHVAEIDEAVVEGARFFHEYNDGIHDDPRVVISVVDGRNFLLASRSQYDVIISEPSNPWMAGLGYLFTQEFYQLVKQRLAPGGIVCQWLQLYRIFPDDVKMMLKTFQEEFAHVSVWSSIPGDLLLIGSMEPHHVEFEELSRRMAEPKIKDSLERIKIDRPSLLLQLVLLGSEEVRQLTAGTKWIHQDNQPWLEFNAPKAFYGVSTNDINLVGLERFRVDPQVIAPGYDAASEEDAEFYLALGEFQAYQMRRDRAVEAYERAAELAPDSSIPLVKLGELHLQGRRDLKAEAALTKAVALKTADAKAYQLLGRLSWRRGDLEAATRLYAQAARMEIPDSEVAKEIGDALREAEEFVAAAEYYRSSISQGGGERPALVAAYAEVLRELERVALAEQVLGFGIAEFKENPMFAVELGELLLDQDRGLEAQPHFEQALSMQSALPSAHLGLGRIAFQQGQVEQAIKQLRQGLKYDPYDQEALELLQQLQEMET